MTLTLALSHGANRYEEAHMYNKRRMHDTIVGVLVTVGVALGHYVGGPSG